MRLPGLHGRNPKSPADARSGRVVAVIHCMLNQNARDPGAARHESVSRVVASLLMEHGAGVVQMPCPEMACLGLPRTRPRGVGIRDLLDTPWGRRCCRALAGPVANQLEEHARNRHAVLAVVGGDVESPGCAIHLAEGEPQTGARLAGRSGVFMKALEEELRMRGLGVPFLAMRESSPEAYQLDLAALDRLLSGGGTEGRAGMNRQREPIG